MEREGDVLLFREEVAWVMASVLSPYVHELLQFSTRRTVMPPRARAVDVTDRCP